MSHRNSRAWWLILISVIGGTGFFLQAQGFPTPGKLAKKLAFKSRGRSLNTNTESPESRIVGGTVTEKHEFPSMVSFCYPSDDGCTCGGTILTAEWVLTAAHCEVPDMSRAKIYAGLQKQSEKDDADVQERPVVEFTKEENYEAKNFLNDIALLKVSPPFEFNDYVKPAYLPDAACRTNANFGKLWAVGWGNTEHNGEGSDDLLKVDVPVINDEDCARQTRDFNETLICTGYPEGGRNACPGDSGGPLYQINGESHVVLGVTSHGYQCGGRRPVFFAEVAYYIDWIDQKTGH